jgi:hypothetical protein
VPCALRTRTRLEHALHVQASHLLGHSGAHPRIHAGAAADDLAQHSRGGGRVARTAGHGQRVAVAAHAHAWAGCARSGWCRTQRLPATERQPRAPPEAHHVLIQRSSVVDGCLLRAAKPIPFGLRSLATARAAPVETRPLCKCTTGVWVALAGKQARALAGRSRHRLSRPAWMALKAISAMPGASRSTSRGLKSAAGRGPGGSRARGARVSAGRARGSAHRDGAAAAGCMPVRCRPARTFRRHEALRAQPAARGADVVAMARAQGGMGAGWHV